jgi:hypothetical protein
MVKKYRGGEMKGSRTGSVLFFVSIALLAGVVAGVTYLLLWNILNLQIPHCLKLFLPASIGLCVALGIEGVLKGEDLRSILLRKIAVAIVGFSIAYYLICTIGL